MGDAHKIPLFCRNFVLIITGFHENFCLTQGFSSRSKGGSARRKIIIIMRAKNLLIHILAVLISLPLVGTVASAATIEVLETFDFPGTGNLTRPQKINDDGAIVGSYLDASGVTRAFLRAPNGSFSAPIVEPNDAGNSTQGRSINNIRRICGEYLGSDGSFHGYFRQRGSRFVEFDIATALSTIPLGINNANDFVGSVVLSDGTQQGFISLRGTITPFAVPDATATLAYQLNASDQLTGYYIDASGFTHGYLRESDGSLTSPIDPPDSTGTILFGNNDSNWVVGRYADSSGVTHGLFFMTPGDFVIFDYPGSTFTSLNGINQRGYICGRYIDGAGIEHGFLAKANRDATATPNRSNLPLAPVKPTSPSPETLRPGAPAS